MCSILRSFYSGRMVDLSRNEKSIFATINKTDHNCLSASNCNLAQATLCLDAAVLRGHSSLF
jgi:hypothetical protein